jgi:hypothetical protein
MADLSELVVSVPEMSDLAVDVPDISDWLSVPVPPVPVMTPVPLVRPVPRVPEGGVQ